MIFFTQGFLFSRTEFRIKKKQKKRFQSYRIFFTRTWTLVINSFISENGVPAKREEKKECFFFSFPEEKFIGHLIRFWWSSCFYIKVCSVFLPNFCVLFYFFFSFSRKSSKVIHSFDFWAGKKMKKKSFFIHSIFLINAQKRTFPGK